MTTKQPMAFYHRDGHIPAWNFAMKYAGDDGHIATLPEIIEARLATSVGDLPWETYFTTNSAEYYGVGSDGREKLIVAHGVGPMSTLEGAKKAYSWEYKDKSRRKNGGRISVKEFLDLEDGCYGDVAVIDVRDYLVCWEDAFYGFRSAALGRLDALLVARLGSSAYQYLGLHDETARRWHAERSVKLPEGGLPYIVQVGAASNCSYDTSLQVDGRFDWSRRIPRPIEAGYAVGHLLSISGLVHMHYSGWQGLTSEVDCHEWSNGVRFVGVPSGASWRNGIDAAPQPDDVLRLNWSRFMRPNTDEAYTPPRLFLVEQTDDEWFTRYPKQIDEERMDDGDIEFHVRSLKAVGGPGQFKVEEDFFLRYKLSQVIAIAPVGANAYEIDDISGKDNHGFTTVTVQFYRADVDTSRRLPRVKEIKQDYDLLMG